MSHVLFPCVIHISTSFSLCDRAPAVRPLSYFTTRHKA